MGRTCWTSRGREGVWRTMSRHIDCASAPTSNDAGFFLTGTDLTEKEKAAAKPKRRVKKRRESGGTSWLKELEAMHACVGDYTGNEQTAEDKKFFVSARKCEEETDVLSKELMEEVDAMAQSR